MTANLLAAAIIWLIIQATGLVQRDPATTRVAGATLLAAAAIAIAPLMSRAKSGWANIALLLFLALAIGFMALWMKLLEESSGTAAVLMLFFILGGNIVYVFSPYEDEEG